MNKTNVFCSTEFHMDAGDVLHLLFVEEAGDPFHFELGGEDDGPPGPPTALDATNRTTTVFRANWMWNEGTMGYYIDVATDIDFTNYVTGFEDLDVGIANYYDVTGLTEGTVYYYRIRAYNDYGISDYSNIIETSTAINTIYGALYNWYAVTKTITTNAYADVYGALYNWHAVNYSTAGAGLAPAGWHVPTLTEWNTLITEVGGAGLAGGALKESGYTHWTSPNTGATNSYGFTALPAGYRRNIAASFANINAYAVFWTATQYDATYAYFTNLFYNNDNVTTSYDNKPAGRSVRLVKDDAIDTGTMTDYDGNVYNTVTIGGQVWMASNLKVRHYNDGTAIPNVTLKATWDALTTGALCFYNNEADVTTSVFAPTGWHVATPSEWDTLRTVLGGSAVAGGHMKTVGTTYWRTPNTGADNSSNFSAVAAGVRVPTSGFDSRTFIESYHTTTYVGGYPENGLALNYSTAGWASGYVTGDATHKHTGLPMRLIKDDSTDPGTVTDYDGISYDTVKIGSQVWTKQNFRCTHYNEGTEIPLIEDQTTWDANTSGAMCWYNNIAP